MTYARNAWYVAAWSHDIAADTPFAISILDDPIVIWRSGASGHLHALADRCVHRMAPLSLGRCEGERLRCMYHGMLFDAHGTVVEIPGQALIPANARVRTYAVVERESWVWVWMGDPAEADLSLIPPAVGLDDPDYILGHGHLDYAAQARLINDNLLDFSHLTFVHANSFGAGPEFARTQPTITALERGVRVERWITGQMGRANRRTSEPVDVWQTYDFLLPGVLLMWSGNFAAGTAAALGSGPPPLDQALSGASFTSQAVTPMTQGTSRYFFSWGPYRAHGDAALRDTLMGMAALAFAEDKVMIEAQQRVIDRSPGARVMPTAHDRSITLFNRLVKRFCDQEAGNTAEIAIPADPQPA